MEKLSNDNDCDNLKCHEQISLALDKKTPKMWLWTGFVLIGLPLLAVSAQVWSEQQASNLRFADKEELTRWANKVERLTEAGVALRRDINDIKANQKETLRLLRKIEFRTPLGRNFDGSSNTPGRANSNE